MPMILNAEVYCCADDCKSEGKGFIVYRGVAPQGPSGFGLFDMCNAGGKVETHVPQEWAKFCDKEGFFCSEACRTKTIAKRKAEEKAKHDAAVRQIKESALVRQLGESAVVREPWQRGSDLKNCSFCGHPYDKHCLTTDIPEGAGGGKAFNACSECSCHGFKPHVRGLAVGGPVPEGLYDTGGRVDSIGTCQKCGYYGPGPRHYCTEPQDKK